MKFLIWILLVFAVAFILFAGEAWLKQKGIQEKTLRLHVVANSDDPHDQAQKLRVRDHILQRVKELTEICNSRTETENMLNVHLEELEMSARTFLKAEGSDYDVSITLCEEEFPTRGYDTFSLPAGTYHSLRVTIGQGRGRNWWCVVFPSLCTASSVESFEDEALNGGYTREEISLIRKEESRFTVQFKMVEILRSLFH